MREINQGLIKTFADRFINHRGAYYQQWSNRTKYGYTTIYKEPTLETIANHIDGDITLGTPALDGNDNGRWIFFDGDDESGALNRLNSFLQDWNWHTVREGQRPGRDGHLWLLFDSVLSGECLFDLAHVMVKLAGLSNAKLEIFPKQKKADKLANPARLPLGIHRKPGANNCRGWFDVPEKNLESQLIWLAEQPLNNANIAFELIKLHKPIILPPVKRRSSTLYREQIDFKSIAQAALLHAKSIVETWLPGGTGKINYTALNPRRNDNHVGSFSVNLRTGVWKDFATHDAKGGDLISLISYLDNCGQLEAAKKLASFIGYSGV